MSIDHSIDKSRVAAVSLIVSCTLAAAKLIIGFLIGSLALISEGLHSSVDLIATAVTLAVVRISDQPADKKHNYGHGKFESLSALGVIALLYVLAGGIVMEAFSRLREGGEPPTITALPFVVLAIDIVANFWRSHALHKAAKATGSHALAADALHFLSDVIGSFAVIAGLALAAFGYPWGDAAAAIGVAIIIGMLGLRLGRTTIETLLDRAPEGVADAVEGVIRSVPGVIAVERTRVRMVGPTYFIDSTIMVPRTLPIDRVNDIKCKAENAVGAEFGDVDLTFTTVPVARDNESVRDRVTVIARNKGLAIHHITVHDLGERLSVSLDLEVDGNMQLGAAHDITRELEEAIRADFGTDVEIDTHIEPLEPELPHGIDAPASRIAEVTAKLKEIAEQRDGIGDIHNVRVRETEAGEVVNFHCRTPATMSVIDVHERVDAVERALRRAFPNIRRVISHAEPAR